MKNVVHCFSPGIVSVYLDTLENNSAKRFELMAAVVMARLYKEQWNSAVMIGFYMKSQHHLDLARNAESTNSELFIDALKNGIDNNNPIDFILVAADQSAHQEFQLKRFGMTGSSTEALIDYLNAMKTQYAPVDAACLVWITDFELIDFPRVNNEIEKRFSVYRASFFRRCERGKRNRRCRNIAQWGVERI